jgi:hypothetical protein
MTIDLPPLFFSSQSLRLYASVLIFAVLPLAIVKLEPPREKSSCAIMEPIQLMLAGCCVSVIAVLNFPLGTGLAVALSIHPLGLLAAAAALFAALGSPSLASLFINDQILDAWILPFLLLFFLPLLTQSFLVRLLKHFF